MKRLGTKQRLIPTTAFAAASALFLAACNEQSTTSGDTQTSASAKVVENDSRRVAVAYMNATEGNETEGTVTFIEEADGIRVIADIRSLEGDTHGFHIHETGDCSAPDASSAGGHFNPEGVAHGGPEAIERHVGDLGNLEAGDADGAMLEMFDAHLSFDGNDSIIGKAVIIHANADDLSSQPSGNAGPRIACGVIELQES